MSWRELLEPFERYVVLPWVGANTIALPTTHQTWYLEGNRPPEYGWHVWKVAGRIARWHRVATDDEREDFKPLYGYLVGDRFILESAFTWNVKTAIELNDEHRALAMLAKTYCIEPGLDHFTRVSVGELVGGRLVFLQREMPAGAEDDVRQAFLDRAPNVDHVKHVHPALNLAFIWATRQRAEADERRRELERKRREEEERLALEAKREELRAKLGDGAGRRELAKVDFFTAAEAALAVGGAALLDVRPSTEKVLEHIVRFRFANQRFECVCNQTMQIVDAGICLHDHRRDIKGDTWLTLESLPGVIQQAIDEHRLVKWRHG